MEGKKKIAIICGGASPEHQISLISGLNIIQAMNLDSYHPMVFCIDKMGKWFWIALEDFLKISVNPKDVAIPKGGLEIAIIPGKGKPNFIGLKGEEVLQPDVLFPITHGPLGEDGSIQGLMEHLFIPYVGPGVLASSTGMDKVVFKILMTSQGIKNARFRSFNSDERDKIVYKEIEDELNLPLFVKPANMGSSVGISKVRSEGEFKDAVELAFKYDSKILIEENVKGRELEVAVLGNEKPEASIAGEVIPVADFYSYEAKYIDEKGAILKLPAENLSESEMTNVRNEAIKVYKAAGCEGLTRVDFFYMEDGVLSVNEINSLPGFTSISMYPKLWELSGLKYSDLISRLIELGEERFEVNKRAK